MRFFGVASLSLLLGVSVVGVITPASAQSIQSLNEVGFNAELAEEYDLAEDMWRQISTLDPDNPNDSVYLGNVLLAQEKWAEAEAIFREGIQLLPDRTPTEPESLYLGLGTALRAQGQYEAAKDALEIAVQMNEQVPFGHMALGRLLRDYGELDAAAEAFTAVIQLEPMAPHGSEAFWALGKINASQGQLEASEANYRRAIALEPDRIDFLQSLVALLRRQGRTREMSQIARDIARLQTQLADLTAGLEAQPLTEKFGTARFRTQLIEAESILASYPGTVDALINLGTAQLKLGRFVEAEAAFRQATALNPENPLANYLLGSALTALGEEVAAQAAYQVALRLYPEIGPPGVLLETPSAASTPLRLTGYVAPVQPLPTLANRISPQLALPSRGFLSPLSRRPSSARYPSTIYAQNALSMRIALNPDDAGVQNEWAYQLRAQDKLAESAAAFRTAARLDPSQAHVVYRNLGVVLYDQGQFDEAIAAFEESVLRANSHAVLAVDLEQSPERAQDLATHVLDTYESLGFLLRSQGRWAEAVALYREILSPETRGATEDLSWAQHLQTSLLSLARTRTAEGQYAEAEAAYLEAIRDYPSLTPLLADELATLLFSQGRLQDAESRYVTAMRDYPTQGAWLHRGLETVLRAQNRTAEADALVATYAVPERLRSSALPSIPSPLSIARPSTTYSVGASVVPSVRPAIGPRPVPITLGSGPTRLYQSAPTPLSAAYDAFGQTRLAQGRYSHAQYVFGSSLSESRYNLGTMVNYGLALLYQEERDEAATIFNQAIETVPNEISCYVFPEDGPTAAWQPADYLQTGESCLAVLLD